jgi:serine transporter
MIIMTGLILFTIDPWLAIFTLLPLPFIAWMIHIVRDRLRTGFEKIDRVWGEVTNVLADTIPGIRVVKAFAQEAREASRFRTANKHNLAVNDKLNKVWSLFSPTVSFLTELGLLVIWVFVYSTAITNDSASFLQSFGITDGLLSENPLYGLVLICGLVALASRGENLLFKISTFMVLTKISVVAVLGLMMVDKWDAANITAMPAAGDWMKDAIIMLPFTLTSILFIQSLSPMVISYRSREKSLEVARFKAMRAMNIAFGILFVVVFFYAVSFTLAMGHDQAVKASEENISALAMVAQGMPGQTLKLLSLTLNIFAVMTAYFGVYLGFREACQGLAMNLLRRVLPDNRINKGLVGKGIMVFTVMLSWGAIVLNAPVLSFTSICSPIFGMVGCLIPAYLVYQVPALHKYKGTSLYIIIVTGLLLCVSPFLAFN